MIIAQHLAKKDEVKGCNLPEKAIFSTGMKKKKPTEPIETDLLVNTSDD